jgi:hypothetical protein
VKEIPDSVYQMVDAMYDGIVRLDEKQILASASVAGGVQVMLINRTHSAHARERLMRKLLKSGAPGEIRTPDLLLRRQSLYPAELRARTDKLVYRAAGKPSIR